MISKTEIVQGGFNVDMAENGDIFLNIGGGRQLIGNPLEGTITELPGDGFSIDWDKYNENLEKVFKIIDLLVIEQPPSNNLN
ncbi:MAG: hypothetical protein WCW93_00935 [Candidatus Paceibacterota bacterium]